MSEVPRGKPAADLQSASLLWSEYEHRHSHCWNTIFQLSTAAVFLSGIPYLSTTAAFALRWAILLAPGLAVFLVFFGGLVLWRELTHFGVVKAAYRDAQNELALLHHAAARKSWFATYVLAYVAALFLGTVTNFAVVACVWLPYVASKGG